MRGKDIDPAIYSSIKPKIMECFNEIQKGCSFKKSADIIIGFAVEAKLETVRALKQMLMQLFAWKQKSKKLAYIYRLLRFIFAEARASSQSDPQKISLWVDIAKDLISFCCTACSATTYLVQLRASSVLRK